MLIILERFVETLTRRTAQIAQIALFFTMLIIVANIITRIPWKPVAGTVEMVEMAGAIMLATAVAYTAYMRGHIMVGVLVDRFPPRIRAGVIMAVSLITLLFSSVLARETFIFAARMMERGYSTAHLSIPVAPAVYLVAFSFAMLALVLLLDLVKAALIVIKGSDSI